MSSRFCSVAVASSMLVAVATTSAETGDVRAWWHLNNSLADESGTRVLTTAKVEGVADPLFVEHEDGPRKAFYVNDGNVTWESDAHDVSGAIRTWDPAVPAASGNASEVIISKADMNELFPVFEDGTVKSFTVEMIAKRNPDSVYWSQNNRAIPFHIGGGKGVLVCVEESGVSGSCRIYCDSSDAYEWQASAWVTRRAIPNDGSYHHLAVTYDDRGAGQPGRIRLYLDHELCIDYTITVNDGKCSSVPGLVKLKRSTWGDYSSYGASEFPFAASWRYTGYGLVIDEIRISDGALEPKDMVHVENASNPIEFLMPMNMLTSKDVWGGRDFAYSARTIAITGSMTHGRAATPGLTFEDRGVLYPCHWAVWFDNATYNEGYIALDGKPLALMGAFDFTLECFAMVNTDNEETLFARTAGTTIDDFVCDWSLKAIGGNLVWQHGEYSATLAKINDGEWHHLALVYRASEPAYAVYVDGVSAGTIADPAPLSGYQTLPLYLGLDFKKSTHSLSGGMFGFRGSPKALAPSEFLKAVTPSGSETELVHWSFDAPGRIGEKIGASFGTLKSDDGAAGYELSGGRQNGRWKFENDGELLPEVSDDVPCAYVWDAASGKVVNPENTSSVRFHNVETPNGTDTNNYNGTLLRTADSRITSKQITVEYWLKMSPNVTSYYCGDGMSAYANSYQFRWSTGFAYSGLAQGRYTYGTTEALITCNGETQKLWGNVHLWHHVAFQFDISEPGKIKMATYRNYNLEGTKEFAGSWKAMVDSESNPIFFGWGIRNPLDGWVDEPRIHEGLVGPEHFMRAFSPRADLTALWLADGLTGAEHYTTDVPYLVGTYASDALAESDDLPFPDTVLKTKGRKSIKVAKSVAFKGASDGLTIPCAATVGTKDFTVEATVKGTAGTVFRKARFGGTSWGVRLNAAGQAEAYFDTFAVGASGSGLATVTATPAAGTGVVGDDAWHHVALTVKRTGDVPCATLYVDGTAVASCDASGIKLDGGDLKIGEGFAGNMLGLRFSPGLKSAGEFLPAVARPGTFVIVR